ncbi:radical SAM/SPASM domain-containing protein [Sulfurimonas sp.]|uniref:radical SAM/SPASM domain-containing protein n=1 Tax=Sulfurimonas sp. TaxID=2022749 RepID=UPI00356AC92F
MKKFLSYMKIIIPDSVKAIIKKLIPLGLIKKYRSKTYIIDLVGSCNLKCPSCPSGSYMKMNPYGYMNEDLFEKIVKRISIEDPFTTVALYNWTEPMLHTKLPEFIQILNKYELQSTLSSNLNILKNVENFAKSNPTHLTISLSGFTQDIYEVGHRGGDIEIVKENMSVLSRALKKYNSSTNVTVYYHKYKHNTHEVKIMQKFAEDLGFNFGSGWAYYMPIERVLEYKNNKLIAEEKKFIKNNIALDLNNVIEKSMQFKNEECSLQENIITMNHKGDIQLCCGVYDYNKFTIGHYLDMSTDEIIRKIKQNSFCKTCKANALHVYSTWHNYPELQDVFNKNAEDNLNV